MYSKLKQAMKDAGIKVSKGSTMLHTDQVQARHFMYFRGETLADYIAASSETPEDLVEETTEETTEEVVEETTEETTEEVVEETTEEVEDAS